jgi:hypothetical protein
MSADDGLVFLPNEDRLDEAKLLETSGQRVEFGVRDAARVGGVGTEVVERDINYCERRQCGGGQYLIPSCLVG